MRGTEHDQARIVLRQSFVVETPARDLTGGEAFDDDVGFPGELERDLAARGAVEVEGQALLPGVALVEARRMVQAELSTGKWPDEPGSADSRSTFHADDIGAEIGQHAGDGRAGDDPREIEHEQALEGGRFSAGIRANGETALRQLGDSVIR